ncbi:hypothetical protein C8J56DRAFT_1163745 [Mycena floridula]|nr:hypothetical protein C8J56DRAFT_1163745 [Mycena floridula]
MQRKSRRFLRMPEWRRRVGNGALGSSFLHEALAKSDLHIPLQIVNTRGPRLVLTAYDLLDITNPILSNPAPMIAKEPEPMTEIFHQEAILLVTIPPRIDAREALLILDARSPKRIHSLVPRFYLLICDVGTIAAFLLCSTFAADPLDYPTVENAANLVVVANGRFVHRDPNQARLHYRGNVSPEAQAGPSPRETLSS